MFFFGSAVDLKSCRILDGRVDCAVAALGTRAGGKVVNKADY